MRNGSIKTKEDIRRKLKAAIVAVLQPAGSNPELDLTGTSVGVILIIGVNGGGKTTTIGKLAHKLRQQDAKVFYSSPFPLQA